MTVTTLERCASGAMTAAHLPAGLAAARKLLWPALGIAGLLAAWWLGAWLIARDPATRAFAGFGPRPALAALAGMAMSHELWAAISASLLRIAGGLAAATAVGVPLGAAIGYSPALRALTHTPFQFLRMISPLAWMPVAVLAFSTWDGAIVFLIAAAAVWPVTLATAHGLRRIDPNWFKVARNLGGRGWHIAVAIVIPAIAQDVLTGIRLALGVAWVVLVPAEYLGVSSGLGYAINDARDTLSYDRLAAIVLVIGSIGFVLDGICVVLIKQASWIKER